MTRSWATAALALSSLSSSSRSFREATPLRLDTLRPRVDYHFHLLSPAGAAVLEAAGAHFAPIDGAAAVAALDSAGIGRAVILSDAYFFDSPITARQPRSRERMQEENDWTAREVARFPTRLVAFCGVNPLMDYAVAELDRCAANPVFRGLKLHFDESGVDLLNPDHVARTRRIFARANRLGFAILTHVGTDSKPPYGPRHARIFVDRLVTAAPDVPVIVGHLWGGGPYSDSLMRVFVNAASRHPNLRFELSGLALRMGHNPDTARTMARAMREIGLRRFLFGSDYPDMKGDRFADLWRRYRAEMPFSREEFGVIANNVAPFVSSPRRSPPVAPQR